MNGSLSAIARSFNPRPVFKPGVTQVSVAQSWQERVSIRARFLSRALRDFFVLGADGLRVSIRARFLSRALLRERNPRDWRKSCFNPRPVFKPGVTLCMEMLATTRSFCTRARTSLHGKGGAVREDA